MEVTCEDVHARMLRNEAFLLLDCRENDEYQIVHIEGATLLPMSEIQQRIGELGPHKDEDIVVYCHHGMRSLQVAMWMQQQGFSNVKSMSGGIDHWAAAVDTNLARY